MKSFSVLTVTKRYGWVDNAMRCMAAQTVQPDSWVVVFEQTTNILPKPGFIYPIKCKYELLHAPEPTKPSNLNASLNEGLRHIDTDYVIFYQDFIDLPEDCFEKLLALTDEKTFVTTCTPNYDGSNDGRWTGSGRPHTCRPNEWETNVAIAPMGMLRLLGGFNEEYDWGWSWDNVNVAERAAMLGAKFIIDESNRPTLLPHELTSKLELELNAERHAKEMYDIRMGNKPIKYKYLCPKKTEPPK